MWFSSYLGSLVKLHKPFLSDSPSPKLLSSRLSSSSAFAKLGLVISIIQPASFAAATNLNTDSDTYSYRKPFRTN